MTSFNLRQVKLRPGEEHRDELEVELPAFDFGGQRYVPVPEKVPALFVVSRANTGHGVHAVLHGPPVRAVLPLPRTTPCSRCRSGRVSTRPSRPTTTS